MLGNLSYYGETHFSILNLDKLASEGMSFTNHYCVLAVSGPSRECLMTGKHTGHAFVRGNQLGKLLGNDEEALANILKNAGYKTAVIGRWGVGNFIPKGDSQQ